MYIMFCIDLLYKKITSMITYFAVVAMYNLVHKEFRATREFCEGGLYKCPHEKQVTFDIFTLCLTLCIIYLIQKHLQFKIGMAK